MNLTFRGHDTTVALIHGYLLAITFTLLFPVGGALYYLLKTRKPRIARDLHGSIQCIGLILAVVGTAIGVSMVKSIVRKVVHCSIVKSLTIRL